MRGGRLRVGCRGMDAPNREETNVEMEKRLEGKKIIDRN